jgi:5-methylcytosine-specific restriction protein A
MATVKGKCEDHQPEPWKSSQGKTASERGYGHHWKKIRKRALIRDSYLCQECLKTNILTKATDVDHILSKKKGGTDRLENLQSLCNPCHKIKTIEERRNGL